MSVSLTGSLSRFSAIELLGFLADNEKSGIVLIDAGGGFRLVFEKGMIVSASHEEEGFDENASELVIRALLQETGTFAVLDLPEPFDRLVELDPAPLIAQALARFAESRDYDPSYVFLLARDLESNELFPADEVRVLLEVNGRAPASEIAKRCGLSDERAVEIFASLTRRGWLISRQGSKAERQGQRTVVEAAGTAPQRSRTTAPSMNAGMEPPDVARMACFTLDDTNSTSFPLMEDVHTIGRGTQNSIRLEDKSVSSAHARITRTPKGHLLEDLGSSNGTFVNGEKIDNVVLADKDRIRLGTVFMVYMLPTEVRNSDGADREKET